MAVKFEKLVKDTADTMKKAGKKKTSEYDTNGIVKRVDGNTAWVHFDGGVDETPVRMTISAKAGDKVRVHVGGGKAYITGNETAPPTDDKEAKRAASYAGEAKRAADNAEQTAQKAQKSADEAAVAASDAYDHAEQADENAVEALQSANGKNTLYYSATAPTGGEYKVGDTWFDTSNDYQIHTWDGSAWVGFRLGEDAIADLSITNAKIANGTIQSAKISGIDAGKITTGYLNAARIQAGSLSIGKTSGLQTALDNAGETATSYITDISGGGVKIQAANATSNYMTLTASAMDIYVGGTNYASYGATSRIGASNGRNISIGNAGVGSGIQFMDGSTLLGRILFSTTLDLAMIDTTLNALLFTADTCTFSDNVRVNGSIVASNIPSSTINGSRDFTFKNANGNNRKLTLTFNHGILTGWDNSAA